MYTRSSPYYDLLYAFKDFSGEAEILTRLIRDELPTARTVLDVACGTHEHARTLRAEFRVDGVDLNEEFLRAAKNKNPEGRYVKADMRDFDLGRKYDVVMSLSSSIGYLKNLDELHQTARCLARHLHPTGVLLVEPWFTPETWRPGKVSMTTGGNGELRVARAGVRVQEGAHSLVQFHYMVAMPSGVETFSEDHHLALFTQADIYAALAAANLSARFDGEWSPGRGLYVARMSQHSAHGGK